MSASVFVQPTSASIAVQPTTAGIAMAAPIPASRPRGSGTGQAVIVGASGSGSQKFTASGTGQSRIIGASGSGTNGLPLVWNVGSPLPAGLAFTGAAGVRTYYDVNGVVQTAALNTPRSTAYVYNNAGVLVPAWVLEGSATDLALRSRTLGTAPWTLRGTATVTSTDGADGTANAASRITVGTSSNDILQLISGLTLSSRYEPSCSMRPTVASGLLTIENPNNSSAGKWTIDLSKLSTSAYTRLTRSHPAVTIVSEFSATGSTTAGLWFLSGDGASHTVDVDFTQFELDGSSTSPIATTTTTVTRSAETNSIPMIEAPQPVTFYGKLIVGAVNPIAVGSYGLFQRGGSGNSGVRFQGYINHADNRVTTTYTDGVSGATATDTGNTFAVGDLLEFIAQILPSGKSFVATAKNGGAFSAGVTSAVAATLPGAYAGNLICLGGLGSTVSSYNGWQAAKYGLSNITGANMRAFV